jgi:H+/Cl- antiporter ClcA
MVLQPIQTPGGGPRPGVAASSFIILTGGSRVQPRVALLKPISAAISIGTGGPFGASPPRSTARARWPAFSATAT